MSTRRSFLAASAVTAALSRRTAGASERIHVAIIGNGHRGVYDMRGFMVHPDCVVAAVCDVYKPRCEKAAAIAGGDVQQYGDYRRILDNKDIDAVLIATPDHWHGPMTVEACQAGKDVYVEKPLSNNIEDGLKMIEAARRHNRVVQVGLQQRSIEHFKSCAKMIQGGLLGRVTHAHIAFPGSYGGAVDEPVEPPPGLDWELFQGPAPRRPYVKSRQERWRAYYDYGGGLVTDWGVHWTDVVHWYLGDDMPRTAAAAAQYVRFQRPDRDVVPDVFSISWQYDRFVMSFCNYSDPPQGSRPLAGVYFYGDRGMLTVNRSGFVINPVINRNREGQWTRTFERQEYTPPDELVPLNLETRDHVANFVECIKTRQRPIADVELGFQSTLPTLMALLAIRTGKSHTWNGRQAIPV